MGILTGKNDRRYSFVWDQKIQDGLELGDTVVFNALDYIVYYKDEEGITSIDPCGRSVEELPDPVEGIVFIVPQETFETSYRSDFVTLDLGPTAKLEGEGFKYVTQFICK